MAMATKNNAKDSIKRTGELLLSGWKLLNSSCPVCNTALMSKGENLRCPMCDLPVVTEANQANIGKLDNLPAPPKEVAVQQFEIEDDYYQYAAGGKAEQPYASLEGAKKEYDLQNKRMNAVSNKLGEKMLAGFSMLSTVCPLESCRGTPLVRQGTAPMQCVCCDSEYHVSSLGDLVAIHKSPVAAATVPAAAATTAAASPAAKITSAPASTFTATLATKSSASISAAAPAADASFFLDMHNAPILSLSSFAHDPADASNRISKRLMQGWALLDHCCQSAMCRGEVPLMRDLEGKEVCVECSNLATSNATPATAPALTAAAGKEGRVRLPPKRADTSSSADSSSGSDRDARPKLRGTAYAKREVEQEKDMDGSRSDGSYSDSEADAELWAQFRESQQRLEQSKQQQPARLAVGGEDRRRGRVPQLAGGVTSAAASAEQQQQYYQRQQVPPTTTAPVSGGINFAMQVLRQKLQDAAEELEFCDILTPHDHSGSGHNYGTNNSSNNNGSGAVRRAGELADLIGKLGSALKALQGVDV